MALKQALTFDDVLLAPQYSEVEPSQTDLSTYLTRNIVLFSPLVSAAMDTVTESDMAIALAREGGIGVIHKNMSIEAQAQEVRKVKKAESGMIVDPITISPNDTITQIENLIEEYNISGLPVVSGDKLVGLVTKRDIIYSDGDIEVSEIMTTELITVRSGLSTHEAKKMLHENRIEKLPVVSQEGVLRGLITKKDLDRLEEFPQATKDDHQRLRVAAAVGTGDSIQERVKALVQAGVDVLVLDSAHGDSKNVHETVKVIKAEYQDVEIVVGNIATAKAAERLVELGVDAIKVGIGPGSTCTTRVVAGVGVPQITAIMECFQVTQKAGIPLIADGGISYSGDIVKALAAGADSVMIGNLFAGTEEAPGETVLYGGRRHKTLRGMGSSGAMQRGSCDRYSQENNNKFVPEGIEGMTSYKGLSREVISQLNGGLQAGLGYNGCRSISELQENAEFIQISPAGVKKSHPQIRITKEAPNYQVE